MPNGFSPWSLYICVMDGWINWIFTNSASRHTLSACGAKCVSYFKFGSGDSQLNADAGLPFVVLVSCS